MIDTLMAWSQVLTLGALIIGMCSFFFWQLNGIRSDMRAFTARIDTKIDSVIAAMHKESKDFHGRLCILEEKYLSKMEKRR